MPEIRKPILAVIQARMGSSRLPDKVLLDIAGRPMLARVVERAKQAALLDDVIVATTIDPEDDPVAAFCEQQGYPFCRGPVFDVLARYHLAAETFDGQTIVRITADCPLIDPDVIDRTIDKFLQQPAAVYASNRLQRYTYPIGLDVEVFTRDGLERAFSDAEEPYQREHVTPFFYDTPGKFPLVSVEAEGEYGHLRWTVDTPEDLEFVRRVYRLLADRAHFRWMDVLNLLEQEPELVSINAHIRHKGFRETDSRGSMDSGTVVEKG
ncbi:MAG: glycosyltransferase family protein [Anaerolineales bacterium]|nr:glycosyltransferase family protein [Anaerolineales bacterium]